MSPFPPNHIPRVLHYIHRRQHTVSESSNALANDSSLQLRLLRLECERAERALQQHENEVENYEAELDVLRNQGTLIEELAMSVPRYATSVDVANANAFSLHKVGR